MITENLSKAVLHFKKNYIQGASIFPAHERHGTTAGILYKMLPAKAMFTQYRIDFWSGS